MLIFWIHNYLIVYTELADIVFHPSWILLTDIRQLHSSACLHHRPSNRIICRPEAFLRGLPQSSFSQEKWWYQYPRKTESMQRSLGFRVWFATTRTYWTAGFRGGGWPEDKWDLLEQLMETTSPFRTYMQRQFDPPLWEFVSNILVFTLISCLSPDVLWPLWCVEYVLSRKWERGRLFLHSWSDTWHQQTRWQGHICTFVSLDLDKDRWDLLEFVGRVRVRGWKLRTKVPERNVWISLYCYYKIKHVYHDVT